MRVVVRRIGRRPAVASPPAVAGNGDGADVETSSRTGSSSHARLHGLPSRQMTVAHPAGLGVLRLQRLFTEVTATAVRRCSEKRRSRQKRACVGSVAAEARCLEGITQAACVALPAVFCASLGVSLPELAL